MFIYLFFIFCQQTLTFWLYWYWLVFAFLFNRSKGKLVNQCRVVCGNTNFDVSRFLVKISVSILFIFEYKINMNNTLNVLKNILRFRNIWQKNKAKRNLDRYNWTSILIKYDLWRRRVLWQKKSNLSTI